MPLSLPSPTTARFRADVAYDGRHFSGWQSQVGVLTVQDTLQEALLSICPEAGPIHASGRTDAGVSARKQVTHFDLPATWRMSGEQWLRALNARLPRQVRVMRCDQVDPAFHARFSTVGKTYRYRLFTGAVLPPLDVGLVWHLRYPLRAEEVDAACRIFLGEHDFRAFSANRGDGRDLTRDARRLIRRATCTQTGPEELRIEFEGNGFLYKMVRFLVGTVSQLVTGKLVRDEVARLLHDAGPNEKAPYCAPPDGLTLWDVHYPSHLDGEPL